MAWLFDTSIFSVTGSNSDIIPGATLSFYVVGTSALLATYSDSGLSVPNANPVVADANARFPAIWMQEAAYKVILKNFDGTTLSTIARAQNPATWALAGVSTLTADLASTASGKGASQIGYDRSATYAPQTAGRALQTTTLTPFDFEHLCSGGKIVAGGNHTPAFVALANAYNSIGCSIHHPDPGFPYLIDPDVYALVPPASYNTEYRKPPYVSADRSAIIRARSGGTYLVKLGSLASDYSGLLRNAEFELPTIDGYNFTFTKAPLYLPFFKDIQVCWTVKNAKRMVWLGDTTAPAPSAGIKGQRNYERELNLWYRPVATAGNGINPTITFAAPHSLWPSSGRRCVCINFGGAGWAPISNKSLDVLVLSSTSIQLLNVDSTAYGAVGTSNAYLNFESMAIAKQISGVTNANPCVVTTAVPHLLATGDTVDLAEIGGMDPDLDAGRTGVQGQYVVTVLTSTTFSISSLNTTNTTTYGVYNSGLGPGSAMPWVPLANCDIGEYFDNCTDGDMSNSFIQQVRIPIYHNPATGGYDGKYTNNHFYNFPEAGEILTPIYGGGDNVMEGNQVDGPFRYSAWFTQGRNVLIGHKINYGAIEPKNNYASMVRTETGAQVTSHLSGLKGTASAQILKDHSGGGNYVCYDNDYFYVTLPVFERGGGKRAAAVRFTGASGAITSNFQISSVSRSSAGVYVVNFTRPVPLTCVVSGFGGTANGLVCEDESYGSRGLFTRQIKTYVAGVLTDLASVSVVWRYP